MKMMVGSAQAKIMATQEGTVVVGIWNKAESEDDATGYCWSPDEAEAIGRALLISAQTAREEGRRRIQIARLN